MKTLEFHDALCIMNLSPHKFRSLAIDGAGWSSSVARWAQYWASLQQCKERLLVKFGEAFPGNRMVIPSQASETRKV